MKMINKELIKNVVIVNILFGCVYVGIWWNNLIIKIISTALLMLYSLIIREVFVKYYSMLNVFKIIKNKFKKKQISEIIKIEQQQEEKGVLTNVSE